MNQESLIIAVVLMAALAAAGTVGALLAPRPARPDAFRERLDRIAAAGGTGAADRRGTGRQTAKTRSVKDALREIEETQRRRKRPTLLLRLRQAGLDWQKPFYFWLCAGIGALALVLGLVLGLGIAVATCLAVAAGVGLPDLYLRFMRRRRLKMFEAEFPNAVDVIVRGVKSGLPFPDCLRIIATESREPLRGEFGKIVRDQTVGVPVVEALERFAQRVPLAEASFFSIVIAIQSRTGGSLSESLGNLSNVLRERRKMRAKIKAMSAEAKASAGIIGSLPIVVTGVIYVTSPDYISLLFQTLTGNAVLAASGLWMLIGVLVMRRMINFDF